MARSTSVQETESAAVPSISVNAANEILQRHRGPRQRFDSADYVLGDSFQRALALKALESTAAGCIESTAGDCRQPGDSRDVELEPEPEHCHLGVEHCHAFPRQTVLRLRLQRFDSADWAMQLDATRSSRSRPATDRCEVTTASAQHGSVAHLLLERHAFRTCTTGAVPRTSACTSSRCAEQA